MKKLSNTLTNIGIIAGTSLLLAAGSAQAANIEFGRYRLSNHPDGNAADPLYGLRLDGLMSRDHHDVYTFDFNERAGTEVFLDYDTDGTIRIHGTVFGGLVDTDNQEYDVNVSSHWDIDFTYNTIDPATGDDDLVAPATTNVFGYGTGSGTISSTSLGTYNLVDYDGNNPYTFRFGDEDDDEGHRNFDGISGWGWLKHGQNANELAQYQTASDWLFTAERVDDGNGNNNGKVPEPTSILSLLALGTFGAGSMLKGKKNNNKIK